MEELDDLKKAEMQEKYEQIFGNDCEIENQPEQAISLNSQPNNEAILNEFINNNIYGSGYVQEQVEEPEENKKSAEEIAQFFIKKFEQIKKILLVVDRFEGDIAVCENRETQEMVNIKKSELPEGINEGDVISYNGEEYEIDEEAKKEIEERIKKKIKNIFEEN